MATPQALSDRLAQLESIVYRTQQKQAKEDANSYVAPFWDVTLVASLGLTPGVLQDWDLSFDDVNGTDWQKAHTPTVHGELNHQTHNTEWCRRYSVSFDRVAGGTVQINLCGEVDPAAGHGGYAQVKINKQIIGEYAMDTTRHIIQLPVIPGRNNLTICMQEWPATAILHGVLWDETIGDRWVDPRAIHPTRQAVPSTSGFRVSSRSAGTASSAGYPVHDVSDITDAIDTIELEDDDRDDLLARMLEYMINNLGFSNVRDTDMILLENL